MKSIVIPSIAAALSIAACAPLPGTGDTGPSAPAAGGFNKSVALQGISFRVQCPNQGSVNKVTITPSGLQNDNSPVTREVDGSVTGAEIADLNGDGSPEIYVYVTSAGSGSYGSLVAFAANNRKSLSEIYLPGVEDDPKNGKGYMGHDRFAVGEGTLIRRFPLYNPGDSNAGPTGKNRQLQYKLVAGEAGWKLRLDRVVEF
jgi:hypothetical protein